MVAKMKYISITGHIAGLNHAVSRYLSRYDIQLEKHHHNLMQPFSSLNPYAQTLRKAEQMEKLLASPPALFVPIKAADAVNLVEAADAAFENRNAHLRDLEARINLLRNQTAEMENFTGLNIDLTQLASMEFICHRFGRFTTENFRRFEKFLQNERKIFFITAKRDKNYTYGVFFTPTALMEETEAVFVSLEFEKFNWSSSFTGWNYKTPAAAIHALRNEIFELEKQAAALAKDTLSGVCSPEKLAIACARVKNLYAAFDVKKYAALSRGRRVFTFSGWTSAEDAARLEAEIETDNLLIFTRHVIDGNKRPPVLLKNLPIVRQFEFFTRLYGLPEYDEIDPTPVLAITYTLLFGLMFGDIGHGAVLASIGIFVAHRYHKNLGGIMTVVGTSAALFGILYGSVFGFEFRPIWRRPTTNITETLIFAAVLGAGLIAFSMLLNMYNCLRRGKTAELIFGANGIAGLAFYGTGLWLLMRVFVHGRPLTPLVAAIAALPLILICFKHPLENFLASRPLNISPGKIAIELFETLLTYATNTVSFVRVGAFAVSHVGMMHVVLQLSRNAAAAGIFILVLGNALVLVIEGLLVGIQVLRLDYYEIFSRFYKGTGKPFAANSIRNRTEG